MMISMHLRRKGCTCALRGLTAGRKDCVFVQVRPELRGASAPAAKARGSRAWDGAAWQDRHDVFIFVVLEADGTVLGRFHASATSARYV